MPHHNFPYPDTFLIVNRFRMHYYHSGTDDPITVVMLHGSRSTAHAYRHIFPHLIAAGFRCFAPDAIGLASPTSPTTHPYTPSISTATISKSSSGSFISATSSSSATNGEVSQPSTTPSTAPTTPSPSSSPIPAYSSQTAAQDSGAYYTAPSWETCSYAA